ncbi:MAG: PIG-L deacetylase family protein [Pirellulales bacterium]
MKRAFAVAAHPDDIEFGMAGTLILLGRAGYELHYMNIANGSCGSLEYDAATTVRVRREEAMRAAARIGAVFHESLVNDAEIFYEQTTLTRLASVMREVAPEILLVPSPVDYMEDHTNACRVAVTAAFCRGMPNYAVEPSRVPVQQPVTIYHAQPAGNRDPLGKPVRPELFVDVSAVLEEKTAMLAEHKSQKDWLDRSQGLDSYLAAMHQLVREVGRMSGRFEYAEGWRKHLHLGFCSEKADPLADVLSASIAIVPE